MFFLFSLGLLIFSFLLITFLLKIKRSFAQKSKINHLLSLYHSRLEKQISHAKMVLSSFSLSPEKKSLLLNSDVTTLLSLLNTSQTTSVEILLTYCERTITIGFDLKAVAELNFSWAYQRAQECDTIRTNILSSLSDPETKTHNLNALGYLFGIPISLKDPIICKGLVATFGVSLNLNNVAQKDGLIVELLKDQGAIPFVTSNVPQVLLINETVSRAYGRAENPWNRTRSSGGSSGGESALISSRCSPLGIGSDLGGSIRTPCLYTGLYGFNPTSTRNTFDGHFYCTPKDRIALRNFKPCCGPIGKSVDDLNLMMKSMVLEKNWQNDYETVPIKWREEIYKTPKKLRIGYVKSTPNYPVSPANERAVQEAVNALKSKGHEIVELEFYQFEELTNSFLELISADGKFRGLRQKLKGESPIDEYKLMFFFANIPRSLAKIFAFALNCFGERRTSKTIKAMSGKSAWEYFQSSEQHLVYKSLFAKWWKDNKLDAFVSPGFGLPAVKHGTSQELFIYCCYMFVWNVLNYPVGAVPITKVRKEEEEFKDKIHKDRINMMARECCKGSQGMPVGVLVATKTYEDELCLFVMKEIENVIKFKEYPM